MIGLFWLPEGWIPKTKIWFKEWNFSQPTLLHNIKGTYHKEPVWGFSTLFFLAFVYLFWKSLTQKVVFYFTLVFLTLKKLKTKGIPPYLGPTKDQKLKNRWKKFLQVTLQGFSWYNELEVEEQMGLWIFNLKYPGLKKLVFLALQKLSSRWVATI